MPEPYKGPTSPSGTKTNPNDADMNRTPGSDQQQPQPNEHLQNQPISSAKTMDRDNQQQNWNDQDPQEGVTEGVTQGHADPQQQKHGRSAEATDKSTTGAPEARNDDGRPPSATNQRTHGNEQ